MSLGGLEVVDRHQIRGLFHRHRHVSTVLLFCVLFLGIGCRIEKRIVEVTLDLPEQQGFSFAPDSPGMSGEAVRWEGVEAFGHASRAITPSQASSLAGYGGLGRRLLPPRLTRGADPSVFCRPFEDVDGEPRVKVAFLRGQSGAGKNDGFILVSFDLVAVTQDLTQSLLIAAQDELGVEFDLGHGNFQVTATHTHSGPSALSTSPIWGAFACDSYRREYRLEVLKAFREALSEAKNSAIDDVEVKIRETRVDGDVESRYSAMPVEDRVSVITFEKADRMTGCLFIYAAHSTYYGPNSLTLSSDLAGRLERSFADQLGVEDCFFLNGVGGNAVARYGGRTVDEYSNQVAGRVARDIQDNRSPVTEGSLSYSAIAYGLPKARINFSACGADFAESFVSLPILDELPRQTKLAMLEIGQFIFVFVPAELVKFAGESLEQEILSEQGEEKFVRFITTSNDYGGYVLPGSLYAKPALEACSSLYGAGHLDALKMAARQLSQTFSSK